MSFVSLQNISTYSLLQSPTKIDDLVSYAKELGYQSIALTDYNYTYGLVDFFKAAQKVDIKPLFGLQLDIKGLVDLAGDYQILLIARNNQGLANINKISSARALKEKNLSLDELKKYLDHLEIIVPANEKSELRFLLQDNQKLVDLFVRNLKDVVPLTSRLYFGVYAHQVEQYYLDAVKELKTQYDLQLIALEDVRYLKPEDQFVTKVMKAIGSGSKLEQPTMQVNGKGSHFLDQPEEVEARYNSFDLGDAIANTELIASESSAEIKFDKTTLPKFIQNFYPTSKEYLAQLVVAGLKDRFKGQPVPKIYQERVKYELNVISSMGFADYFLIVWDVINYAHTINVTTGPGRGSAAGSLVAYALKITEVDPIEYDLLFERFLNPSRAQMPDIDFDIPDNRRTELLQYMFDKYGMDHVAQIITFGTFGSKQALRDIGRIFGMSMMELSRWSNAIPHKFGITLKEAYQESKELQAIVKASATSKLIFKTALKLEGLPRHDSTHAAGIVLTDSSLATIVGLQPGSIGLPVTQQAMGNVEQLGLLKIDFLGLRNLTILGDILAELKQTGVDLDPKKIPLNDQKMLKLFQEGDTEGVFQFDNSEGIKQALREIHPTSFEDIIATNALYRPGPSQNIPLYAARKNGKEQITYPDPSLKEILQKTFGIIVYQEQVMQVAQKLAGFTLAEADILRRAISKKKTALIDQMREKFISGAKNIGHDEQVATKVFDYIERFGDYGFNRSHAVAYSKIAAWLAYLKVHYPAAFYIGLLNSSLGDKNKATRLLNIAQIKDIEVQGPNVNESLAEFRLSDDKISIGLLAVKGVSRNIVSEIIVNRTNKKYESLRDFLQRLSKRALDETAIANLIKAGAFDKIENNRRQLLDGLHELIGSVEMSGSNTSLFEILEPKATAVEDFSLSQKAVLELDVLGISLSQNRMIEVKKYGLRYGAKAINDFTLGEIGLTIGQLINRKEILTKNNETMAFLTFTDGINQFEVTVFPNVYDQMQDQLLENSYYLLKIRAQADRMDSKQLQFILNNIKLFKFKN